jgi:hypothetical protein
MVKATSRFITPVEGHYRFKYGKSERTKPMPEITTKLRKKSMTLNRMAP